MGASPTTGRVLAATGHRPQRLGGYGIAVSRALFALARAAIIEISPTSVISGMALGWDTAIAEAALDLDIPFVAAIPFAGQESRWPSDSIAHYRRLLSRAASVEYVSPPGYSAQKMQARNIYMIDRCDILLALYSGEPGGTYNAVRYAQSRNVPIVNLWDRWSMHHAR